MAPTPTLPQPISRLLGRQEPTTTVIVDADPTNNDGGSTSNSGLDGGAIAGIVIGTVVGILLLWWIIRACTQPRDRPDPGRQGWYDDTVPPPGPRSRSRSAGRHHHHSHHHGHHHSPRRSGSRHHSRRRSSTPRPVMVEERYAGVPARPAAAYYTAPEGRRSRSRSQGRYYVSG